jgi:hypothetical protein
MKTVFAAPRKLIAHLALAYGLSAFSTGASALEETLQSAHFQLFKLSDKPHPPGRWDQRLKALVLDLRKLRPLIEAHPDISEGTRQRLAGLTKDYTRPFELRDVMLRDDVVYFSDYWTRKSSPLTIVEYRKAGTSKDLSPYLGPLAEIETANYGVARFEWRHQGEVLSFWGAVQKESRSFNAKYWVNAQLFLPLDDPSNTDIAILSVRIPTNHMAGAATYLLFRRSP